MVDNTFIVKDRLTRYALSCGYIETKSTAEPEAIREGFQTRLSMDGGVFFVDTMNYTGEACEPKTKQDWHTVSSRVKFASFRLLGPARKCFDAQPGRRYIRDGETAQGKGIYRFY